MAFSYTIAAEMNTDTINKIKSNINPKFSELFTKDDLLEFNFVPINKQAGFLFVVIKEGADKSVIAQAISSKSSDTVKFISFDSDSFTDFLDYYISEYYIKNSDEPLDAIVKQEQSVDGPSQEPKKVLLPGEGPSGIAELSTNAEVSAPLQSTQSPIQEQEAQPQPDSVDDALKENASQHVEQNKPNNNPEPNIQVDGAHKKRIGEILIEQGLLTNDQLVEALTASKKTATPIGSTLVSMGFITVDQLKDALAYQQGFKPVTAQQLNILESTIRLIPEDFIKENLLIPLASDGKFIDIGMVNPNNKKALTEVVYLTGMRPRPYLMSYMEFKSCMTKYFGRARKETKEIMRKIEQETLEFEVEESLWEQVERELEDTSGAVANFATKIITDGIDMKASDIHIEPRLDCYTVRYRIDGILRRVLDLPSKVETSLIARFKVLARMNIAEHRRMQDGTFTVKYKGISYDFRINTLPVSGKEKMVIRILAPAASIKTEDKVIKLSGGTEEDLARINKMVAAPNGIILAVGPTGSGKTTTLYSILKSLNNEGVNITTLEDPVEIKIDGLNQSQVNPKAGITFASCMRAILRQDPDIILIGEIRDFETLETAIAAALTGHLVLSTLHTNSAAATITRLIQMGAADYLISSTLTGIVAQRLVRRLCPKCKEAYHASPEEARLVVATPEEQEEFMKRTIYRPKGCFDCNNEGYKGRIGCYEVMLINKEIKKMIAHSAHDVEIEEAAVGMGMKTLQTSCLGHILRGETTISEYVRVLGPITE